MIALATSLIRRYNYILILGACCGVGFVALSNAVIIGHSKHRCYNDLETIPTRDIGLVLGASPFTLYYENRLNAAADLYHAGKLKHVLVSGDNGTKFYDEATAMKHGLIKRGVPASAITCDYAGFRTYDSIIRAGNVFDVKQVTVISQKFHNTRAIYIASYNGIDAIAFNAQLPPLGYRSRTLVREVGARTIAFIELHITGCQPRFLGKKEPLVLSPNPSD